MSRNKAAVAYAKAHGINYTAALRRIRAEQASDRVTLQSLAGRDFFPAGKPPRHTLISGDAGTGKSTLVALIADEAASRGYNVYASAPQTTLEGILALTVRLSRYYMTEQATQGHVDPTVLILDEIGPTLTPQRGDSPQLSEARADLTDVLLDIAANPPGFATIGLVLSARRPTHESLSDPLRSYLRQRVVMGADATSQDYTALALDMEPGWIPTWPLDTSETGPVRGHCWYVPDILDPGLIVPATLSSDGIDSSRRPATREQLPL